MFKPIFFSFFGFWNLKETRHFWEFLWTNDSHLSFCNCVLAKSSAVIQPTFASTWAILDVAQSVFEGILPCFNFFWGGGFRANFETALGRWITPRNGRRRRRFSHGAAVAMCRCRPNSFGMTLLKFCFWSNFSVERPLIGHGTRLQWWWWTVTTTTTTTAAVAATTN